ncbi:MAG: hypothetical protein H7Z14_00455 [Anaerolineae bacterium]|nr:hypothetical protein [Phycisphaerae bacterium]
MFTMWGKLRHFMCFCFLGLCMGSLWLFAASANVPSIPAWRADDQKPVHSGHASGFQAEARLDHDYIYDVDVDDTTAAAFEDADSEFGRRST